MAMRYAVLFSLISGAASHGAMTTPLARTGVDHAPVMDGKHAGCTMGHEPQPVPAHQNSQCYDHMKWFCGSIASPKKCTTQPGPPTIPEEMYSSPPGFIWGGGSPANPSPAGTIPWRSAGTSVPASPCGIHETNNKEDGKDKPKTQRTVWYTGQAALVGHSIAANHGGGYSWRLCPDSVSLDDPIVTENCFRQHPLSFADELHTIKWTNGTNVTFLANQTSSGTTPAGSQWRRNPIPSLEFCGVGLCNKCPKGWSKTPCPAFEPPCPGCWGGVVDAQNGVGNSLHEDFEVLDRLNVPAELPEGGYVLQWRWDTESLPGYQQVWTNCADISIKAPQQPSMLV